MSLPADFPSVHFVSVEGSVEGVGKKETGLQKPATFWIHEK